MAGGEEGDNFLFTPKSSVMLTAMLKKLAISFSVLTLILASGFAASAAPKQKLLFFTKSSGFEHSVISWKDGQPGYAEKVLLMLGEKNGGEFAFSERAGSEVAFQEERYSIEDVAGAVHVRTVIDAPSMKGVEYQRPPCPTTWPRKDGKGRVWFTASGQRDDMRTNPLFQNTLV